MWPWIGLTAFLLLKRWLYGRTADALQYMDWAASRTVNVLRVFSQVDWDGVKGVETGFLAADFPDYDRGMHDLLIAAAARGLRLEMVVHTFAYNLDAMVRHTRRVDAIVSQHGNGLLEDANEPPVNQIPLQAIIDRVPSLLTPLASSGQYNPSPYPARSWVNDHPPRDDEFARKAKGAIEFGDGSGPYAPFAPPWRGPVVLDEPKRIDEGGTADDWRAFGAGTRFFTAGGTIHGGVWAQTCTVPTDPVVLERLAAYLDGLRAVPLQRYRGYQHPNDQGSLRRYRRQGEDGRTYELSIRPFAFTVVG